ncbi:MAG: IS30 family transposase [Patescibacteria group bacterium]|nr:IS30 family transposase [Patescibacteria group bacterium]
MAEREIIRRLSAQKRRPAYIARVLGKHRATICREIKRNSNAAGIYYEKHAQTFMLRRRLAAKAVRRRIDRDYMLQNYVEQLLKANFSPEQIAGYMRRSNHPQRLSHKSIYSWIHREWRTRRSYLRFKGRPRVPYGMCKRLWQPHKRHISARPRIVEKRMRVGDWEADLVHGTRDDSRHSLLTINERASGFVIVRKLTTLNPLVVAHVFAEALRDLPVHTITCDNGFEFAQHKRIEKLLKCQVYFTDTHSPQQRGANENLNGLLREFFPKGTSMAHVSQYDATRAAVTLNRRPRKRLGYDCPRNVFAELTGASHYLVR